MTRDEALKIVTALAVVFPRPEWTDERRVGFASLIEDLPYESVRTAANGWMRTESRQPAPADIRRLAQKVPVERGLPAPEDIPRRHPGTKSDGAIPVEIASDHERARMLVQYAANMRAQGVRFNRPDLAYEARRLGVDASPFEVDDDEVKQRRGESVSQIVQRVLDARKAPF